MYEECGESPSPEYVRGWDRGYWTAMVGMAAFFTVRGIVRRIRRRKAA